MSDSPNTNPSEFLSWKELMCRDGHEYPMEYRTDPSRLPKLITAFEIIRKAYGKPITILSSYRSPGYNALIGGAKHSQHVEGRALDLKTPAGMTPVEWAHFILDLIKSQSLEIRGLGLYRWGCHIDVRPQPNLVTWTDHESGDI